MRDTGAAGGAVAIQCGHHDPCWRRAEEEARYGAGALRAARERVRVAREQAAERRRRAHDALAAGQEVFAQGLLDAAEAHDLAARVAQVLVAELERRSRDLLRIADATVRQVMQSPERTHRCAAEPCAAWCRRELA